MSQVFVPISDDILYNHPELLSGRLIAYSPDMAPAPRVAVEATADGSRHAATEGDEERTPAGAVDG